MTRLLTVTQAADVLQLHPETVRRHLRSGALRGVHVGGVWRVPEEALLFGVEHRPPRRREPRGRFAKLAREIGAGNE